MKHCANKEKDLLIKYGMLSGWDVDDKIEQPESSAIAIEWFQAKFQQTLIEIEDHFSKYRLSDALMAIYKLIWDDFCSWLLEMVKPAYGKPIDAKTYQDVLSIFEDNLKILHPFMPFLTEEIWQYIDDRTPEDALIITKYPQRKSVNQELISEFDFAAEVISGIRSIRKEKNISFKDTIAFSVLNNEKVMTTFDAITIKLGNLESINYVNEAVDGALTFRVKSNEYFVPISGAINVEEEIKKLTEELNYTEGFLKSVQKKLSNERFVNNAPGQVIAGERKKEADALAKIETLKASLKSLS
jgi:valyl-tRNA synthetase